MALTTFKVAVAFKAYPKINVSVEQVGLVEASLLNVILSSEDPEAPWLDIIYQERSPIVLSCLDLNTYHRSNLTL